MGAKKKTQRRKKQSTPSAGSLRPKRKLITTKKRTKPPETPAKLPIEVSASPEALLGSYSNFAIVQHSKLEFIMDHVWKMSDTSLLVARIIMSPYHAKQLHKALGDNIEFYEQNCGPIKTPSP